MSRSSPSSNAEFVEEKRKLLYWIAGWTDEETHFDHINLDVPEVALLLQSMGFRMETFNKASACDEIGKSPSVVDKNMMRVDLGCPISRMKSTLVKQTTSCKCPSEEELENGQFWCITACGPSTSQNSINTSNSSLLPRITAAKTKIVKALLSRALMVINGTDVNENEDGPRPIKQLTRHRSLDTLKNQDESGFSPRGLKRHPSWEVDPKTSPPTQTSSPLPSLCATMNKISLNCGQSNVIVKNLQSIKQLVDETLELASGNNATFVKNATSHKRVSDIKPTGGPCITELIQLSTPPATTSKTARRLLTPKKLRATPGEKRDAMAPPTRMAMRKKPLAPDSASKPGKLFRKDTPRPRSSLSEQSAGSCESIFKSKIATNLANRVCLSPAVSKGREAGTSGIARFKSKLTLNTITPAKKKT